MKEFLTKHKFGLLLVLPGVFVGLLYWKYVGCASGTCQITSNYQSMVLFGGLIGYFVGDSVDDIIKKRQKKKDDGEV